LRSVAIMAGVAWMLSLVVLTPLALAEAARGTTIAGATLEAGMRLPAMILLFNIPLIILFRILQTGSSASPTAAPEPGTPTQTRVGSEVLEPAWARPSHPGPSFGVWAWAHVAWLAFAFFVIVLLPLADPALTAGAGVGPGRYLEPGSLPADGRRIYLAEGCASCHTQRMRFAGDGGFGPRAGIADHAGGPALGGLRRAGADLTWTGDRFDDIELIGERLAVHAAGGVPAFPWLFERAGPLPDGHAVAAYLDSLRLRPAPPNSGEVR
jgi:mono/diheme cytochrome c family protein